MDAILTAVLGATPQLGGASVLVVVLVILVRRETQTTERHSAELNRVNLAHDAELAEIRAEVLRLRTSRDSAEQELDRERALRRHAENAAAHAMAGVWPPPEQQWSDPRPGRPG